MGDNIIIPRIQDKVVKFKSDIAILNCSPHPLVFQDIDGATVTVQPCGYFLPADICRDEERAVPLSNDAYAYMSRFVASDSGLRQIEHIRNACGNGVILVGSLLSAMAYPGQVYCAVNIEDDFRRRDRNNKVCSTTKFTLPPPTIALGEEASTGTLEIFDRLAKAEAVVKQQLTKAMTTDPKKRKISLSQLAQYAEQLEGGMTAVLEAAERQRAQINAILADIDPDNTF